MAHFRMLDEEGRGRRTVDYIILFHEETEIICRYVMLVKAKEHYL